MSTVVRQEIQEITDILRYLADMKDESRSGHPGEVRIIRGLIDRLEKIE